jgi:hypothetical protein
MPFHSPPIHSRSRASLESLEFHDMLLDTNFFVADDSTLNGQSVLTA